MNVMDSNKMVRVSGVYFFLNGESFEDLIFAKLIQITTIAVTNKTDGTRLDAVIVFKKYIWRIS
jgi:hypothetical protein